MPTLEEIVKAGKAHYIGVTGYPVSVLKECIQKSKTHISTVLSYTRMTLIDDTLKEFMMYFQVININVKEQLRVQTGKKYISNMHLAA